ncbi:hypothetical protein Kpol_1016p11 [Vanderwaltozyma polyspora DSM 70294]|uniref:CCR4-associated factor 4 homolog n=1 Tax=Vanderwaltozyma polyspora (strain ATCC 22028 / DSM 70294 / BCRC 21397 / CBS 2163 / NBRC 10782 / NRRL Y-8283 / UCD 57-17) TaxID=436907 RepID=CAF4_VANPO|nr:uncharacterized protein Kpol_1016p11 [Vanderwaltozyma polyspora DSM 70294]A7TNS8.1 RecName: Full=CCR4-associated factor 4 homolog [Vanderwaltozyma polyspora DSM 70294]EDO16071.1 hypothetical protein Kpol_1016p11 [Vanderwaltozyma polyspora DSM 70294]
MVGLHFDRGPVKHVDIGWRVPNLLRELLDGIGKEYSLQKCIPITVLEKVLWKYQSIDNVAALSGKEYSRVQLCGPKCAFRILCNIPSDQLVIPDIEKYNEFNVNKTLYEGFLLALDTIQHTFNSQLFNDSPPHELNSKAESSVSHTAEDYFDSYISNFSRISETNLEKLHSRRELKNIECDAKKSLKILNAYDKLYDDQLDELEKKLEDIQYKQHALRQKKGTILSTSEKLNNMIYISKQSRKNIEEVSLLLKYDMNKKSSSVYSGWETTNLLSKSELAFGFNENNNNYNDDSLGEEDANDESENYDTFNLEGKNSRYSGSSVDYISEDTRQQKAKNKHEIGTVLSALKNAHENNITCLDFDEPFGTLYSAGQLDNTIKVWDLSSSKFIGSFNAHLSTINCMQLDTQQQIIISGGRDSLVRLWDIKKFQDYSTNYNDIENYYEETNCIFECDSHSDEISSISYDNFNLLTGSQDKTIKHWDLITGKCVQTFDVSFYLNNSPPFENKFSPTKKNYFAHSEAPTIGSLQCFESALASGTKDGLIRLWDLRSGKVIRILEGHTDAITSLKFDMTNLITGSLDKNIRIWDMRNWSLVNSYGYQSPVWSLDFNSANVVSATGGKTSEIFRRKENNHCIPNENYSFIKSEVQFVKYKEDWLIEGRSNGDIEILTI